MHKIPQWEQPEYTRHWPGWLNSFRCVRLVQSHKICLYARLLQIVFVFRFSFCRLFCDSQSLLSTDLEATQSFSRWQLFCSIFYVLNKRNNNHSTCLCECNACMGFAIFFLSFLFFLCLSVCECSFGAFCMDFVVFHRQSVRVYLLLSMTYFLTLKSSK